MNPDNYICFILFLNKQVLIFFLVRVYSQNKHLNEIEHKYSNLFGDDRLNSGENALQKGNNAQSLKTLLKYPLINALPIRIKNSSSAERENKDLENDGQNFRKFNVLPYISPFSNFQQNLLPTISVKITKKKKFTKESPYAFKANKKESEKRISQLKQKNFNVNYFLILKIKYMKYYNDCLLFSGKYFNFLI